MGPAGFDSWEATGALATGFVAKEVVVSSLTQMYGANGSASTVDQSFVEDMKELVSSFGQASIDTLKTLPAVVGIDLLDSDNEQTSAGLMAAIRDGFDTSSDGHGALAGLAFMVFVLVYTPCVATAAAQRSELGSRWMWTSVIGQTFLAWILAVIVFQGGRLLGVG
jgi:ferrous iron transport protein B